MDKPTTISIDNFIKQFPAILSGKSNLHPWEITENLEAILNELILHLDTDFGVKNGIAIHKTAVIEQGVTLKAPMVTVSPAWGPFVK